MKQLFIAGNWKSNKTVVEAKEWIKNFHATWDSHVTVVLCAPYTLLAVLAFEKLSFTLGAQDVSSLPEGAYTGEINAKQLKEFVEWVIIGHSERRSNFGETNELLAKKVVQAKEAGLKVIYCVQNESVSVPKEIDVIAYEPPWAISAVSNWKTQSPEEAGRICQIYKNRFPALPILYGGSANADNVVSFISQAGIDGVLSGGASLISEKFANLISAAVKSNV